MEYLVGQFGSAVPVTHILKPLISTIILALVRGGWRESLDAVKAAFINSQNIGVYQDCFSHKCKAPHYMSCYEASSLHSSQILYRQQLNKSITK